MPEQLIPISEAQAGMITARAIKDQAGRVLIQAGSRLNPIAIRRFPLWEIAEIYIDSDELPEVEPTKIKTPSAETLSEFDDASNITQKFAKKIKSRFRGIPNNDFYKEYVLLITKHILENKGNGAIPGLE